MASLTIENYVKTIYQLSSAADGELASTGALAEALGVSPSTVTSMLKTLSESGLAEYVPYGGAKLTDAGRTLIDAAFTDHLANEHRLLAALDPADVEALRGILTRWLARLEDPPPTP